MIIVLYAGLLGLVCGLVYLVWDLWQTDRNHAIYNIYCNADRILDMARDMAFKPEHAELLDLMEGTVNGMKTSHATLSDLEKEQELGVKSRRDVRRMVERLLPEFKKRRELLAGMYTTIKEEYEK